MEREKSDAENLLKSANAINQSRRNLEQNIKFLEDKENLHDLGIAFGISGFVLVLGLLIPKFGRFSTDTFKTSTWKEYVFGWMSHPTYVISLSPQANDTCSFDYNI